MKQIRFLLGIVSALMSIGLSGCMYGQCMNGPCALERDAYLKSIKPYGQYWEKDGMTVEERREDAWACGAARTVYGADRVWFTAAQEEAERRPDEQSTQAASHRLTVKWVECMKSNGYSWSGPEYGKVKEK